MRINRYVSLATGLARRKVDLLISSQRIKVNDQFAQLGQNIEDIDTVKLDDQILKLPTSKLLIAINKPPGYVVSRTGQGSKTIYDLIPKDYHQLKPIGRLDKDSRGLLLLTNDGDYAFKLTHPSFKKPKIYQVVLDRNLDPLSTIRIKDGVKLKDGFSKMNIRKLTDKAYELELSEGRNRQIRRTFKALGYNVLDLDRQSFDKYQKGSLRLGEYRIIDTI